MLPSNTSEGASLKVKFGVHLPPEGLTFVQMREACLAAEKQGYDLFTMTDHFYPMRETSKGYPLECWSTLAGLAAVTERIRLGPLVSCVWYRSPALLGKIATTVDIISNGRLILGIGAGWHEAEFKAYYGLYPTIKDREDALEETAQIIRSMLHKRETTFNGKRYRVENLVNLPQPIQKAIPIMIGGSGERRTLRTAAKYGDISHFFANNAEEVERKIGILKEHCRKGRRDFSEVAIGTSLTPVIEGGCLSTKFRDYIEACVGLGVSIFTVRFSPLGNIATGMQRKFADEIIPSFQA